MVVVSFAILGLAALGCLTINAAFGRPLPCGIPTLSLRTNPFYSHLQIVPRKCSTNFGVDRKVYPIYTLRNQEADICEISGRSDSGQVRDRRADAKMKKKPHSLTIAGQSDPVARAT